QVVEAAPHEGPADEGAVFDGAPRVLMRSTPIGRGVVVAGGREVGVAVGQLGFAVLGPNAQAVGRGREIGVAIGQLGFAILRPDAQAIGGQVVVTSFEAQHVEHAGFADEILVGLLLGEGRGHGPGRVEALHGGGQLAGQAHAGAVKLLPDFVADAPQKHARVVAVAPDLVFQIALVPLLEIEVVVLRVLLFLPHVEGLIQH
nr:hypothetical protein [Tanacetum cinerariifolium]